MCVSAWQDERALHPSLWLLVRSRTLEASLPEKLGILARGVELDLREGVHTARELLRTQEDADRAAERQSGRTIGRQAEALGHRTRL